MPARRQYTVVLVHLSTPVPGRQMLDDTDRDDQVEGAVGPREPPRLVVPEVRDLADAAEAELRHLRTDDGDERRIGVERGDCGDFRLIGEVLGHVAKRAADLEDRQVAGTARAQVAKERTEEVRAPRLLVGKVRRRAGGPLALDQHADYALAVPRDVLAPVHHKHTTIAEIGQEV